MDGLGETSIKCNDIVFHQPRIERLDSSPPVLNSLFLLF